MSICELDKSDCKVLKYLVNYVGDSLFNMATNIDVWSSDSTKEELKNIVEKERQIFEDANNIMKKCGCNVQLMKPKERKKHEKQKGLKALMQKKQEEWENIINKN